jgi:hypothetical protein
MARAPSGLRFDARTRDVSGMAGVFLADAGQVEVYVSGSQLPVE